MFMPLDWVSIGLAMQIAAVPAPIGVAAAGAGDGRICVAMPEPALTPGTALTLIQPDGAQSRLYVSVVQSTPQCELLERALVPGPYYLVKPSIPKEADLPKVWVALSGRLQTRRLASGAIAASLSRTHPGIQFRRCTSREGFHLTVWSGTPLTSERLWHQYYYLGYDVDPSCDDRDVPK